MISTTEQRQAEVLDGARVAEEIKREVVEDVSRLRQTHGVRPGLVAVRVGDDPASAVYVGNKVRTSESMGLRSEHLALPVDTSTEQLLDTISSLNARGDVDGILVQLPLPGGVEEARVLEAVDPGKDVDGFHPLNVGNLTLGREAFVPCTPAGIYELLRRERIPLRGAHACVVGRSNIVGRPLAQLLLQADATVTICHSQTQNLSQITRTADILIAAVGRVGLIRGEHVKPGAVVIDVGMNRVSDEAVARELFGDKADGRIKVISRRGSTLVGDVHPAEVGQVAGWLTPVPGGVGPLTVAMLMKNTLLAAMRRRGL